jgi:hypothetical protein
MKKLISMLFLVAVFALFGSVSAFAVPAIDGNPATVAGEWLNDSDLVTPGLQPYSYYLDVIDPDESDNMIQEMDISHVVLIQQYTPYKDTTNGDLANSDNTKDGIYLLIETFNAPSLQYADLIPYSVGREEKPRILMSADFFNNGLDDSFNLFIRTYNSSPTTNDPADDKTQFCFGTFDNCDQQTGAWTDLVGYNPPNPLLPPVPPLTGHDFGGVGAVTRGSVIEYFIPSGTGGVPHEPFPGSFVGYITYDNGASGTSTADDLVVGTLIPEPASMFLMLSGLVGLAAKRKFLAKR